MSKMNGDTPKERVKHEGVKRLRGWTERSNITGVENKQRTNMETLQEDKELLEQAEKQIREEKHKNRNQYHPVGLVSHQQRIENQKAFEKWMVDKEPTFFITFVYNRKFSNQNVEQMVSYLFFVCFLHQ